MPKERSGNDGGAYGSADGKAFVAERPCDHGDEHGNGGDAQQMIYAALSICSSTFLFMFIKASP